MRHARSKADASSNPPLPLPPLSAPTSSSPERESKRQKVTRACDSCKSRKRRCTGELPCKSCFGSGSQCTYNATYTRGRLVQPPVARTIHPATRRIPAADSSSTPEQVVSHAQKADEDIEGSHSNARTSRAASPEGDHAALAGRYSGHASAYSFLRRAWRRFGMNVTQQDERELNQEVPIFQYGDKQLPRSSETLASFTFPDQQTTAELLSIYFDFAMPTYRFLHQPTVASWLAKYHEQPFSLLPVQQAVVLMVLATGSYLKAENKPEDSEPYFQAAQMKLASESGKLRIESVQARLAMCLYLLHTSRPNQAWYTFGISSQIIMALGMHRARASSTAQVDTVTTECRKRAFWAAFTLDTYLSCILGRPALIHMDDIDQKFPEPVDDDEVLSTGIQRNGLRRDPVILASICHARVTKISKKALREQYSVQKHRDSHRLNVAAKLNAELAEWKASLPVVLSGAIHPSSLVQIFQRQIVVLELASSLTSILINRPLLLVDSSVDNKANVNACLSAAKTILDVALGYIADKRNFPAFWFTQYVTFNALSIVYIWLIQRKRGRLSTLTPPYTDDELYQVAEAIQKHLAEATHSNAPSLRYSLILEELQQETSRLMAKLSSSRPPTMSGLLATPTAGHPYASPATLADSPSSLRTDSIQWDSLSGDLPFDSDIWLQLDAFPFPDLELEQWQN